MAYVEGHEVSGKVVAPAAYGGPLSTPPWQLPPIPGVPDPDADGGLGGPRYSGNRARRSFATRPGRSSWTNRQTLSALTSG